MTEANELAAELKAKLDDRHGTSLAEIGAFVGLHRAVILEALAPKPDTTPDGVRGNDIAEHGYHDDTPEDIADRARHYAETDFDPIQVEVERIIFRRVLGKRVDGYTLETSHEIAAAVRTILTALTQSPRSCWQPIETAPKDGTAILVTRPTEFESEEGWHVVRWDDDWWQVHCGKSDHPLRGSNPTYWQPLPATAIRSADHAG